MTSRIIKDEELLGKLVIDHKAKIVGKVTDLGVSYDGKAVITVQSETPEGTKEEFFYMDRIAAIGDVILLKPPTEARTPITPVTPAFPGPAPPSVPAPAKQIPSPPPPPTSERVVICPVCGAKNRPTAKFCIKCGTKLVP
ncbi:MAG TPA: zinc-ribbon domain-containing protein [Candidatus Bathyarchaeota archaeon]|nr:zinc-ribbon domain-containing protein [Candidatus Bathyarchaeota archaeon]